MRAVPIATLSPVCHLIWLIYEPTAFDEDFSCWAAGTAGLKRDRVGEVTLGQVGVLASFFDIGVLGCLTSIDCSGDSVAVREGVNARRVPDQGYAVGERVNGYTIWALSIPTVHTAGLQKGGDVSL